MEEMRYLISDAAKKVEVESHVLRYWEEELEIPIKRNELGHRYYTQEDVERFREIKNLKEQGLQLKAIRMIMKDGKLERWDDRKVVVKQSERVTGHDVNEQEKHMIEIVEKRNITSADEESRESKNVRLQMLLQQMIAEAVRENNRELCEDIKQCVLKEIDYQFRQQDEKEDEREAERRKREEEHYKKIDEMLRTYNKRGSKRIKMKEKEKEKVNEKVSEKGAKSFRFSLKKKPSVV